MRLSSKLLYHPRTMGRVLWGLGIALLLASCDGSGGGDGGASSAMDAALRYDGGGVRPVADASQGDAGGGCVPQVELCGDRVDQNCDGRDQSCGDSDSDGIPACRPDDVDLTVCDCDDDRADVRPGFGSLPGAPEVCDGVDNDCNMRVDEHADCCDGCGGVEPRSRADVCRAEDGACDCVGEPGVGPCPVGQVCCATGCVDTQTDAQNCGVCGTACAPHADTCVAGDCRCGSEPPCRFTLECSAGTCS